MKKLFLFLLLLATPAYADVLVKTGIINKSTGAATASQPVTGIGFQPKALIFYTIAFNALTAISDAQVAISWTTGAGEEFSNSWTLVDNQTTTENNRNHQNTKLIGDIAGIGTASALADLTSFDADGFTLSWTTNTASANKLAYIAIGGSDIEANATSHTMPTGADAASKNFAHGLSGGGPDIVFLMTNSVAATGLNDHGNFSFGAAMSSSSRWTIAIAAADAATTNANQDAVKRQTTAKCLQGMAIGSSSTDGFVEFEADYSTDDATNVTLNFTTKPAAAHAFTMLAIRGGNWALGATNKATSTGNQTIASGLTATPKLLMMVGYGSVSGSTAVNDDEFSFGASDGTSQASLIGIEEGTTFPTQTGSQLLDTKIFRMGDAGASSMTITSEATWNAFTSTTASVNWTPASAVAEEILWATVGQTSAVPIVPILTSQWRQRRQ